MTLVVIPTTILLTLFAAELMGYTINRVSLFALIFSIGILVDDAIVVVENIARHWAMRDGRDRMQAAIEAVAEVGNPTVVATLTVIAALLPMLFVSGLMGPYMAPIPANASAAMLFSFFVAMVVAPWLMLQADAARPAIAVCWVTTKHRTEAGWGALYRGVGAADRALAPLRPAIFLGAVGVATVLSAFCSATKAVTVKLLPFDNKSELDVMVDLPEGASLEDTERTLFAAAEIARQMPEVRLDPGLCRHGSAVQFQRPGAALLPARIAGARRAAGQPLAESASAAASSHAIALDLRQRLTALDFAARHRDQGGRGAARAAGAGDAAGRDLRPRCRDAPRGSGGSEEDLQVACPTSSISTIPTASRGRGCASRSTRTGSNSSASSRATSTTRSSMLFGGVPGRLFASRRGPQPDRDRDRPAEERSGLDTSALASTPVPANALPGSNRVVELGDVVQVDARGGHARDLPPRRPFRRHGDGELAGAYRSADLRHARGRRRDRHA